MRQCLLLLTFAFLLTGCASRVVGLQKDQTFTHANLKSSPLVLGGIVDNANDRPNVKNLRSLNALKTQITEEAEGLKVSRAGLLRAKLGRNTYKRILREYQEEGGFSQKNLDLMAKKLGGKRYVIFSRIEKDEVSQNRQENVDKDKDGNKLTSKTINMVSGRSVDAGIDVVDLVLKKIVWSGTIRKQQSNTGRYSYTPPKKETEDNRGLGGLINLVKAFKGSEKPAPVVQEKMPEYKFPKAPSTQVVLNSVFRGFAENLPEED